jgi:hypothetical protein
VIIVSKSFGEIPIVMMIIDFVRSSVGGSILNIPVKILPEEGIHQDDKEECFDEGDSAEL